MHPPGAPFVGASGGTSSDIATPAKSQDSIKINGLMIQLQKNTPEKIICTREYVCTVQTRRCDRFECDGRLFQRPLSAYTRRRTRQPAG